METLVHPADAAVNRRLTKEDKIRFLREMFRMRRFEQTSLKYYNLGRMGGFLHLYSGQEAIAVGTMSLLGDNDHVITAYRDHGHALVAGMDMKECMAELFGKATGCSKGKGGSMHFSPRTKTIGAATESSLVRHRSVSELHTRSNTKGFEAAASAVSVTGRLTRAHSTSHLISRRCLNCL
jgi:TPP-dependent pyruvate/acetoin dehydrogenase alpha subunit